MRLLLESGNPITRTTRAKDSESMIDKHPVKTTSTQGSNSKSNPKSVSTSVSRGVASSVASSEEQGDAGSRAARNQQAGMRGGSRRVFDELPGTSEGKAALLDFELGEMDFAETRSAESQVDEVVEEQVCFDFGAEFEAQLVVAQAMTSVEADSSENAQDQKVSAMIAASAAEPASAVDEVVAANEWIGDERTQLEFGDAESIAEAIADTISEARPSLIIESDAVAPVESDGQLSMIPNHDEALGGSAVDGGTDELEMRLSSESGMILDETALPAMQVGTDDELMQSIDSIPDKMAFKIGEVADMVGVKQYVLRYWESEFDALRPRKSRNGQRVYTRRDVETALMIKKLLYTDRFSIEGARVALKQLKGRVREEKEWKRLITSHEKACNSLRGLVIEIRRVREALA